MPLLRKFVRSGMAILDEEESGMKVEVEKQKQNEGPKTSSLATLARGEDIEMDKETAVAASRPRGVDSNSTTEDGGGSELGDDASEDGLPMSRARCIALVATVTGAAFLNVSETTTRCMAWDISTQHYQTLFSALMTCLNSNMPTDPLRPKRRHHPAHHRPPPLHPRKPPAVDRLVLLAHLRLLPALLGPHRRLVRQAPRLYPGLHLGDGDDGGESVCAE